MAKYKVVVTDDRHKDYEVERQVFSDMDVELTVANCQTEDEVIEACKDADGILCNLAPMPARVIESLEKCKVISRYGVGFDNVDVNACTKKGIWLANVTDYCMEDVSDHALALLMSCARKTARRDAQVRKGMWNIGAADPIYRLAGKTFSFLGFGKIARCLHRKIVGFNFAEILVYDPYLTEEQIAQCGAKKVSFEEAISKGDYISIHIPLTNETRGVINAKAFDMMKNTAIIVNTSRGPIINEKDLIDALKQGKINSAGLDVHNKEPLDKDSELFRIENCVLTDHVGWYSEESIVELKTKVAENVKAVLNGGVPAYPVNRL
jgi:D-3-phosphoglycerate dehydrogenase